MVCLALQTVVVGSYLIAHGFFSVYAMCVDTLFLCFCEYHFNPDPRFASPPPVPAPTRRCWFSSFCCPVSDSAFSFSLVSPFTPLYFPHISLVPLHFCCHFSINPIAPTHSQPHTRTVKKKKKKAKTWRGTTARPTSRTTCPRSCTRSFPKRSV